MSNGILAGFPVVDVAAVLYDGSYHDVDSSVLAFQIAARGAFRDGMKKGGPRLLEPIMKVCMMRQAGLQAARVSSYCPGPAPMIRFAYSCKGRPKPLCCIIPMRIAKFEVGPYLILWSHSEQT